MLALDFILNCQTVPPLQVFFTHGRCCLRLICQACKCPITRLEMAGVAYGTFEDAEAGVQQVALILCKSPTCLNHPLIRDWLWDELCYGMTHALQNAGIHTQEAWRKLWVDTLESDSLFS